MLLEITSALYDSSPKGTFPFSDPKHPPIDGPKLCQKERRLLSNVNKKEHFLPTL